MTIKCAIYLPKTNTGADLELHHYKFKLAIQREMFDEHAGSVPMLAVQVNPISAVLSRHIYFLRHMKHA